MDRSPVRFPYAKRRFAGWDIRPADQGIGRCRLQTGHKCLPRELFGSGSQIADELYEPCEVLSPLLPRRLADRAAAADGRGLPPPAPAVRRGRPRIVFLNSSVRGATYGGVRYASPR